ncbi:MAG TPA: sulfurtransferase [Solirubrobacteraceae bacterium]|nr:sulfurtransferase [Solirubrobacteraceae bacterium]
MIAPFVDAGWLAEHRCAVVLADVRWYLDGRSGRAAYEAGHIPDAAYVGLGEVLSGPPSEGEGRHPFPSPERFAAGLSRLGISEHDTVVAYDDAGGAIAARLVWMLRILGQPAAVLDGGLTGWSGTLQTGPPASRPEVRVTPREWPAERMVGIEEVADTDAVLIDARDASRFAGGPDPVDPRSGHIPGARSLPAAGNLGSGGRLRGPDELRRRFAEEGIAPPRQVISYCGSGVSACHNLLALEYAGLPQGRLYAGSWSQWSRDSKRPVATGPDAPGG